MPIIGKIRTQNFEFYVQIMEIGSTRYINFEDIIVTKEAVFLNIFTEVLEDRDDDEKWLVSIKRLGPGFTADDFEIDLSSLDKDCFLYVDTSSVYQNLIQQKDTHIIFYDFILDYEGTILDSSSLDDNKQKLKNISPLEQKRKELEKAEEDEDFDKAAKLRDEIEILQKNEAKTGARTKK